MTKDELLKQLEAMEDSLADMKEEMSEDPYIAQLNKLCDSPASEKHFDKLVKRDFEDLFHFDEPF